jgi:hypothetical protein
LPQVVPFVKPNERVLLRQVLERSRPVVTAIDGVGKPVQDGWNVVTQTWRR